MRFLMRQMGRLLGLFVLLVLVAVIGARAITDGYGCVRYTGSQMLGNGLLDTHTGARFGIANPTTVHGVASDTEISPDGKSILFLEPTYTDENGNLLAFNLKVRPLLGTGKITIQRHLPGNASLQYRWSPDSRSIAYTWLDFDMTRSHLALTRLPNETLEVTLPEFQDIQLMGFSPDGRYLVTSNQGGSPRTVIIWGVDWATHQLTERIRYTYRIDFNLMYQAAYVGQTMTAENVWWSPNSKWLALITISQRDNQLVLLDPAAKVTKINPLTWIPYRVVMRWSPDDQYLALATIPDVLSVRYRLDIFGVDGRTWNLLTNEAVMLLNEHWSGGSFYYFENTEYMPTHRLKKFSLESGATELMLTTIFPRGVAFFDNGWTCVPYLSQNSELINLTDSQPTIYLNNTTGCNIAARSKDDSVWVLSTAESSSLSSPTAWKWIRFAPFQMGDLAISSFHYIGWSDDERWLAYASSRDFNLVNAATISLLDTTTWQSREVLTDVASGAYLSPDGHWLFGQRTVNGTGTVIMAATDGSQRSEQPLNSTWPILTGPVFWSPDSRAVTYEYRQATDLHVVDMLGTDGTLWRRFYDLSDFAGFPRVPEDTVWTNCSAELP